MIEDALKSRLVRRYEADSGFQARVLGHLRRARFMSEKYGHKLRYAFMVDMPDDELERHASENALFRANLVLKLSDVDGHLPHGRTDADFARYRLAGKEDQIYSEFDRRWTEGEFRLALAIPSLALWIILAIVAGPFWLAGLLFSISIAYIGAKSFSDAEEFLYTSIRSGRLPLEGFDSLEPRQILMKSYANLLADDSPAGTRDPASISLSDNEFYLEMNDGISLPE
ncbi:hypothetical protein [Amycolatopsis sp. RTGN1]|uniref:hypothetical protein n=1 Tax=Amycolatopsis ponsaeliensis TaxID=2992142 RepID=UPI00254E3D6E|nr:hypothetical protein [Amycolatopsis sp. RTGN1]